MIIFTKLELIVKFCIVLVFCVFSLCFTTSKDFKSNLLFCAAGNGYTPLVKLSLYLGADPNDTDTDLNWTPLKFSRDNSEVVHLLTQHGANINATVGGSTALMEAVRLEDSTGVRVLLAEGADPEVLDQDGHAAIWYVDHNHDQWPCSDRNRVKERSIVAMLKSSRVSALP